MKSTTRVKCCRVIVGVLISLATVTNNNAQTSVTIGTGVTASYFYGPYYRSSATSAFNYSKYAYLYSAAELSSIPNGALITQVEWQKAAGTITAPNTFSILMANNASTALTTGTTWGTLTAGATTVYSSITQGFTATAPGWESFTLSVPFAYTGGSLQIMTDHFKQGTASGANNYYYSAATGMAIGAASNVALTSSTALTTTYGNNRPNIRITYILPTPCTGQPNTGVASISSSTGCPSTSFTLFASGLSSNSGITNQWQSSSSASGPWTNIVGATNSSYTTNVTTTTFFQLVSTCTNSTLSSTTNVVSYTVNNPGPCVCSPYTVVSATSTADEDIGNVTVGTMSNTTTCSSLGTGVGSVLNMYSNYTGTVAPTNEQVGSTVNFSVSAITCGGNYGNGIQIYIDYNQNGTFTDPGEQAYSSPASVTGPHTETGSFTIPPTATVGTTRMRVVCVETTFPVVTNYASSSYTWGETEDYCINLIASSNCSGTPTPGTAAISTSSGCPNANFTLSATGFTIGTGITYQWQTSTSATGPWTNIVGATTTSYVTNTTSNAFYQLLVTCTNSSQSATSNVVSYTINNPGPCVCSPYAIVAATSNADEDIGNVTLGTLSNTTTCTSVSSGPGSILQRYNNYAGVLSAPTVYAGQGIAFSVSSITCGGNYPNGFQIYVDLNADGDFADPGEQLYSSAASVTGPHTETGSLAIPLSATVGLTRVRVVNIETTFPTTTNYATTAYTWGETEDYCLDILAPSPVDMAMIGFDAPANSGCHTSADTVRVRVQNQGSALMDFSVTPMTINASAAGVNPVVFPTVTVNSGTLAIGAFQNILIATNYNMSAAGIYSFSATINPATDGNSSNNTATPDTVSISGGSWTASNGGELCLGSSVVVSLLNSTINGSVQWESSPDGITWTPVVGANLATDTLTPLDTTLYRAIVCGQHISSIDTLFPEYVVPATTVNDTICGSGTVTLSAAGSGILNWYDAATGGNMVNTGVTYSVAIANTDTFYVENATGTPPTFHQTTYAAGNGSSGNVFTIKALTTITITGFDGHLSTVAGTPSTWEVWYRPNNYLLTPGSHLSNAGWTQLGTGSVNSAGPGNPTPVPVSMNLVIPAGSTYSFQVFTTTGSVSYTNGTALGALYNANTDLEVYQGHGGTAFAGMLNSPRVFNGRIHYSAGCGSARTPVIGVVNPPPAVSATSSNSICGSGTSTLVASSVNSNYVYTWTPAATLNTASGDTVIASPSATTIYIVTGNDAATGCSDSASVSVIWAASPTFTAAATDDSICAGVATQLYAALPASSVQVTNSNVLNTTTTYPAPYGNWYGGARHQMLILASELTAAGLTAGNLSGLSFQITSIGTSAPLQNFTIEMMPTTVTSITTWETGTFQTVYTNALYTPTVGVNTHNFSSQFYWDGVSNIIVQTCFNNLSFTVNCIFRQTTTAFSSTVYYRNDNEPGVCGNPLVTASIAQRPNIGFLRNFSNYAYSWTPTATLATPTSDSTFATPSVSTLYNVVVTDNLNGCVSVDSINIHVLPTPVVNLGADTVICSNQPLTLDGSAGLYTYLWSNADTTQMIAVNAFGTYDVLVTDTTSGCAAADTILVGVNVAPSFTLGTDVTICAGNQTTFTGPSGTFTYLWSNGDTLDNIVTGTAGSYDLTVTDTTTSCFSTDTVVLNVNPVPVVALGADTSICSASGSLTLSAPAGNYTYLWSTTDTTQVISVNTTGNYDVLVVDTATSCSSSDTIQVIYNTSPVVALGNDTTFCSNNGPITLVAPAGPYNLVWSDNSTGTTLSVSATGNYYLDVTDSINGCVSTDSIMVNVPMSPAVTLNDTAFCGTSVVLNGPAGSYMYMWSTSDTTQSILVTVSGVYTLTATDSASGCIGTDSATVNVNANPVVTATASSLTPCVDDANVILTGTPAGGTFTGSSVTGSQFDPSIGAGTYSIVYNFTDANGCSGADTVTINVNACVGVNENFAGSGMNVYPNPNSGLFTFAAADMNAKEMTIEIVTIEGQVIKSDKYSNVQGNFTEEINMNEFANGVYFMRVTTDGSVFTQRIVKQD